MEFHGNSYLPRGFHIQKDVENHHGGFPRSGFMIYKWWVDAIGPVCAHGMEFRRILVGGIPTIVVNILLIMVNIWLLYG